VTLEDRPLAQWGRLALARRIGFLPHDVKTSFSFSVEEVVAQGRYPHQKGLGILGGDDLAAIRRAMEWTHTLAFARRPLANLSSGERQLALLASVLAQGSDYLLLDEPTSNLDLHHQVDVFQRVHWLTRRGLGVIVITHDLNLAAQYCDRLILLHEGKVEAEGTPATVLDQEILRRVYAAELIVDRNPVTGTPLVVLLGRAADPGEAEAAPWPS
jgi:iron complex transport system ATP-binding protein